MKSIGAKNYKSTSIEAQKTNKKSSKEKNKCINLCSKYFFLLQIKKAGIHFVHLPYINSK